MSQVVLAVAAAMGTMKRNTQGEEHRTGSAPGGHRAHFGHRVIGLGQGGCWGEELPGVV